MSSESTPQEKQEETPSSSSSTPLSTGIFKGEGTCKETPPPEPTPEQKLLMQKAQSIMGAIKATAGPQVDVYSDFLLVEETKDGKWFPNPTFSLAEVAKKEGKTDFPFQFHHALQNINGKCIQTITHLIEMEGEADRASPTGRVFVFCPGVGKKFTKTPHNVKRRTETGTILH